MKVMEESISTLELQRAGQSPWLDQISRKLLKTGELKRWIQKYGLLGVTSNPSIFEKAISQPGGGYGTDIKRLAAKGVSTLEIYDALTLSDIQKACDLFLSVFKKSKGEHGFVSLEVLPGLAYDMEATLHEARRLFKAVARPNVMIKVPSTSQGISAVKQLISEGININITLMFSGVHYRHVANAYLEGLEELLRKGGDLSKVHSVASIFVSRIDSAIDKILDQMASQSGQLLSRVEIEGLKGKAAIANSKQIYQEFKKIFYSDRFNRLQSKGATLQKVLWGSTSTKNPQYPDLLYVETLIGPETVNTMPQQTFEAFLDHGKVPGNTIEEGIEEMQKLLAKLKELGVDLDRVCQKLQQDGVKSFCDSFDALMRTLEIAREEGLPQKALSKHSVKTVYASGSDVKIKQALESALSQLDKSNFMTRLMARDAALWKKSAEHETVIKNRLGWLKAPEWILGKLSEVDSFVENVHKDGIQDIVLLGMGGSSLAPEVMSLICPRKKSKRLFILDTTDPDAILDVDHKINLKKTLFIVASKSGSTLETLSQFEYFYERYQKIYKDAAQRGQHFTAITDENSSLQKLAEEKTFRKIWINPSDIGGRYSALSFFGIVPAALCGIECRPLIHGARYSLAEFSKQKSAKANSATALGAFLAACALSGRDQFTIHASKTLEPLGAWLEQLIAESTGKEGKGILPVVESPLLPEAYGKKRVFLFLQYATDKDKSLTAFKAHLKKTGAPILEICWQDLEALGSEFLRWEIATAVAGALLGVNPFDEPNVTESKQNTGQLLSELRNTKKLAAPDPIYEVSKKFPLEDFLGQIKEDRFLAVLCYAARNHKNTRAFLEIQKNLSEKFRIPVVLGFGPRYLHSIGQFYKGGPLKGLFLFFLNREAKDAAIPGKSYRFSELKRAQAFGDLKALRERNLPVLALDLGKNISSGLSRFAKEVKALP